MCCAIGAENEGISEYRAPADCWNIDRVKRGLILTTDQHEIWVIEAEDNVDSLLGSKVIVDGVITGIDRVRADWIGPL
jgi:hypothetical protein